MENHLQYLLRNDNQKVQLSLQFTNSYKNHISKTSSKINPLRPTTMLCCPTSSCEKCYTQTRAVPGLSHLTEMAACQLIFQGVACLHTQKPEQNKPLLEHSWHRMRGKWGREQTGKGSVLDFLFWRRPYVLLPPCRPAALPPIRDLESARELRTG